MSRRPIRDAEARLDPATTWLRPKGPVTQPIPTVRLDDPDPSTPLFDALWSVWGMSGRHALNSTREIPLARHADFDNDGVLDHLQDVSELDVVDSGLPTDVPDTGDETGPDAPDPTPDEVTHPDHHDFVEPYTGEGL